MRPTLTPVVEKLAEAPMTPYDQMTSTHLNLSLDLKKVSQAGTPMRDASAMNAKKAPKPKRVLYIRKLNKKALKKSGHVGSVNQEFNGHPAMKVSEDSKSPTPLGDTKQSSVRSSSMPERELRRM